MDSLSTELYNNNYYYYYYTRLTASFPGQPGLAGTRKVKPVCLNEARDDGVLGCNGISWTICKQSAPHSRQITTTTPHQSIFTGRMLFLTPNQRCQSTEGISYSSYTQTIPDCSVIWVYTVCQKPRCTLKGYKFSGFGNKNI